MWVVKGYDIYSIPARFYTFVMTRKFYTLNEAVDIFCNELVDEGYNYLEVYCDVM